MSISVIWCSPNKNGLTASARDNIIEGIHLTGQEINVINLNNCNIKSCRTCANGWGDCKAQGKCCIEDDFEIIYQQLVMSDGIVWITPVYWHDIAENLKIFLDRLRRCETAHNHYLREKKCMIVACAGGTGRGAIQCLNHLETTLTHMEMQTVERVPVIRFNRNYMLIALISAGRTFSDYLKKGI